MEAYVHVNRLYGDPMAQCVEGEHLQALWIDAA